MSKHDDALAQLLIELAFLVPKGTNMGPDSPLGKKLIAYRDAVSDDTIELAMTKLRQALVR